MRRVYINRERLWETLMAMGEIGALPKGGSGRLALSDLDIEGRNRFIEWSQAAGLTIHHDAIGNLFARREGRNNQLPPILLGSHLDTQPEGGKYDGVYGVLAALEVVRTLNDLEITTEHPLEIAVWTNEEGARFSPAMLGSEVFTGALPLSEGLAAKDRNGVTVEEELKRHQIEADLPLQRPITAYFEAHIEQGPILEAKECEIGVVTGGQSIIWLDIILEGVSLHAGTVPMSLRRDPLLTFAACVQRLEERIEADEQGKFTIGELSIQAPSRNTIPGAIEFTLDIRHPDDERVLQLKRDFIHLIEQEAQRREVEVVIKERWHSPAQPFNEKMVEAVQEASDQLGYKSLALISGAGHDAINLAKYAPTTMIFIPCVEGISHNELEKIYPSDAERGANVLLHALLNYERSLL